MIRHCVAGLVPALALLAGCASPPVDVLNPLLFHREVVSPQSRTPGHVALLVPAQVQGTVYRSDKFDVTDVRLPIGRVVEQAMLTALGDRLRGEVRLVSVVPPADGGFGATLVIDATHYEYHDKWLWIVPLPPPVFLIGEREATSQLALDVSLRDAAGRVVWTRSYDAGREIWKPVPNTETPSNGLVRLAHEAAWRLAQQAVGDLIEWLNAERMKPREL